MSNNENSQVEFSVAEVDASVPDVIPVLPADGVVIFPYTSARIVVPSRHKQMLHDAVKANGYIGSVAKSSIGDQSADEAYGNKVGTLIRVMELNDLPDGNALVSIRGLMRMRILETVSSEPYLTARVEPSKEWVLDEIESEALRRQLVQLSKEVIELSPQIPDEVSGLIERVTSPFKLAYILAGNVQMDLPQRLDILRHDHVEDKMKLLIDLFKKELDVLKVSKSINDKVSSDMSSQQRKYHLRQQMEAIRKELGEDEEPTSEAEEYADRIEAATLSDEARTQAERELKRMKRMSPQSAEYPVIQSYLDWLLELPWELSKNPKDVDIDKAQAELDKAHFGMEDVKERVIEYIAVHQLQKDRREQLDTDQLPALSKGVILCLVGPPGTGKTSLGRSIAAAMGRAYTRMSLGGIRDESEIRGHRRTYVGAMPGRIIQAIKRSGSRNPVFILDEVDKIGQDWRGDPSSALLEVLDPEQNATFRDHYLDVDFDLSEVVFVATANQLEQIPAALRDRMDVIPLEGYTEHEKFQIAQQYLIPRQMAASGLFENEVTFMDEAIHKIIQDYTREAGVRGLERQIGVVCRKSAVVLQKNNWHSIAITSEEVKSFLKREKFEHDLAEENEMPGIATGLAVTAVGGEILHIEATRMTGSGRLILTGQLGDVMKESGRIAFSYVRSRAEALGIDPELFNTEDVHLHIPAGALPKDGPSAGVVMTLALASAFSGQTVPGHIGATGEITLRGRVLPVGGIKMKLLAAHRAGLSRVLVPARNRKDIDDLPEDVTAAMHIDVVENMDDVIDIVFRNTLAAADSTVTGDECRGINCDASPMPV